MNNLIISYAKKWLHLSSELIQSQLFDEKTFYKQFLDDLKHCKQEVIIESPFITTHRAYFLLHAFQTMVNRKIKVYVITRDPNEHDIGLREQAEEVIRRYEAIGVQVLITKNYSHRKFAIIDKALLWEGSLNILSQSVSRELMRRTKSEKQANEYFNFIELGRYIY